MPRRFSRWFAAASLAFLFGCGSTNLAGPPAQELPSGAWTLTGYRLGDGPLAPAGPATREGHLVIEPDGYFRLDETVASVTTRREGIVLIDGANLTLLATNRDRSRVEGVLQYLWATDGERMTLTTPVDNRWELFAYARERSLP